MDKWQEEAIRLFDDDMSYNAISKMIGETRPKTTRFLQSQGLYRKVPEKVIAANEMTADKLRNKDTHLCKQCGSEFTHRFNSDNQYCSRECAFAAMGEQKYSKERTCIHCGKPYTWEQGEWQNGEYCSQECYLWDRVEDCTGCGNKFISTNHNHEMCSYECRHIKRRKKDMTPKACKHCGVVYVPRLSGPETEHCGRKCAKAYYRTTPGYKVQRRRHKARRRLRSQPQWVEDVPLEYLIDRDKGVCQLCGKKVKLDKLVPHPKAPTNDHVIPLSQGGEHSKRNCQLAHFICNSTKSNGNLGAEQLMLFG